MPQEAKSGSESIGEILKIFGQTMQDLSKNEGFMGQPSPTAVQQGSAGLPPIQYNPQGAATPGIQTGPGLANVPYQQNEQFIPESRSKTAQIGQGMQSLGNSIMGLVNKFEERAQQKKVMEAKGYMTQINSFLESGNPQDRQYAMMMLEDPKVRKVLKTGLGYVPYQVAEEPPPPEAVGVQEGLQSILEGKTPDPRTQTQPQPPPGWQPRMQTVLPQPSQGAQLQAAMQNALVQTLKNDPQRALSLMGASQLTASEQRLGEFYEKGLGMSPADVSKMDMLQKVEGIKAYQQVFSDMLKGQLEMMKIEAQQAGATGRTKLAATSRERVAQMLADTRKSIADASKAAGGKMNVAIANLYRGQAQNYARLGQTPGITDELRTQYQNEAKRFEGMVDTYVTKDADNELLKTFIPYLLTGEGVDELTGQ